MVHNMSSQNKFYHEGNFENKKLTSKNTLSHTMENPSPHHLISAGVRRIASDTISSPSTLIAQNPHTIHQSDDEKLTGNTPATERSPHTLDDLS